MYWGTNHRLLGQDTKGEFSFVETLTDYTFMKTYSKLIWCCRINP